MSATETPARGSLYVVSAPSGAGKTSLVRALAASDDRVRLSTSHTTRPRRPNEADSVHYHFIAEARFQAMAGDDAFLEHARVFGHWYGTAREAVTNGLVQGFDVVLEIDWQGARQVRERMAEAIGIFVLPPSRSALEVRLRGRAEDDEEVIAGRLQQAVDEMAHYHEFDYLVVNDDFERALADIRAIFHGGRLRQSRQAVRQRQLLADLLESPTGLA